MALETRDQGPTVGDVPGLPQKQLTAGERRRLERALARIESVEVEAFERRREFALVVRELGISASARHMGLTPAALSERLKTIERAAAE